MSDVGGGDRERKKEENVINNVIITSPSTSRLIVTFSIAPRFFQLWENFLKIVKREAGSRGRSEVFAKMLDEYVRRHELNPQPMITTYMDPLAPSPMRVLCWSGLAGATSEGQIYCRKHGGLWIQGIRCYSCENNVLRKKEAKK